MRYGQNIDDTFLHTEKGVILQFISLFRYFLVKIGWASPLARHLTPLPHLHVMETVSLIEIIFFLIILIFFSNLKLFEYVN